MKSVFLGCLAAIFLLSSCHTNDYRKIQGEAHGTTYSVVYNASRTDIKKIELDSVMHAFDLSLSTYNPESQISRLNRSDTGMYVDSLFIRMYRVALEVNKQSQGAFDITVAPLVNIYGFGYTEKSDTIDKQLIDSVLQYVGMDNIRLENNYLRKLHPLTEIDGNAIAKGLSADNTAAYLDKKGIKDYLVEIGGEIVVKGKKQNRKWIVGIDQPIDGNFEPGEHLQEKIELTNAALATSGNYRRYYELEGKKYVHTINPLTGESFMSDLLSVSIIAPDCVTADAYATACMAMGLERSKALVNTVPGLEAYFISSDSEGNFVVYMTEGMKKMVIE